MNNDTIKKYWEELEFKSGSSLCDYNYIRHPHIRNFYNSLKLKTINCYINPFQFRYDINEWVHSSKHNNVDISSFIRKDIIRNVYDCIDAIFKALKYKNKSHVSIYNLGNKNYISVKAIGEPNDVNQILPIKLIQIKDDKMLGEK